MGSISGSDPATESAAQPAAAPSPSPVPQAKPARVTNIGDMVISKSGWEYKQSGTSALHQQGEVDEVINFFVVGEQRVDKPGLEQGAPQHKTQGTRHAAQPASTSCRKGPSLDVSRLTLLCH